MFSHLEGHQKEVLQPGDKQGFVKSSVPTLPLLLTQNVFSALSLITYVVLLLMRVFFKVSQVWILLQSTSALPSQFQWFKEVDPLGITERVLS